ncbi:N,N'-diacetylchitobiose phosphorylase [Clostridium saccharobutylicum]|uniref:GH36-type glycosyl hydrolase domain-containing protein n=1 Tax=Clostridium saccharobutylicum TaxID=169679 RepID=UPI000983AD75|nr:glucoamylase family protein [Clostridium saccharobutylicum]AQS12000.1 N,N'-diacetylchitobiose phosphorylase [Clostridium saccharobutylicum]MBC2435696.1 glycosyl transferase [Clostridium saccharobutylicum]NSB87109.1 cellobiose phosphorylase [Clostridium saccharobutylicum]OOM18658.1 N,N'-diacetylchitobiose phosphorylase [Clostridium saccharobutylicum]
MKKNNSYGLRRNVLKELNEGFSNIYDNFKYFKKLSKSREKVLGAAEWLLDNIYLIEKEYRSIKKEMPIDYFKSLPSIEQLNDDIDKKKKYNMNDASKSNNFGRENNIENGNYKYHNEDDNELPRIFVVAKNYIGNGGKIDGESFIKYINKTQEESLGVNLDYDNISTSLFAKEDNRANGETSANNINAANKEMAFRMGELWAFPLMIKIAIIINLSKHTNELVEFQKEILEGKSVAEEIIDAINNNNLNDKLEALNEKYEKFSPLFLREFFRVLKDNTIENDSVYNFAKIKWGVNEEIESAVIKSNLREEFLERNIGECITSIRKIEGISWRNFFENTSLVDRILREDPENVYASMDFESKDYYRHKLEGIAKIINRNEISVAYNVLKLAKSSKHDNEESYKCHVGYYLIDSGMSELEGYYHNINDVISEGTYLAINALGTLLISAIFVLISSLGAANYTRAEYIISFLIILIPVNEIVVGLTNWIVGKTVQIRLIPKMDFSKGIPDKCKTIIAIPAIINSKEKVKRLMEKLEVAYCGNKDKNFYFALLSDFEDSNCEVEDNDKEIINCGIELTRKLNEKYAKDNYYKNSIHEARFFFLSRKRIYNKKQNVFMGKERKRGKLMEFMALIRGKEDHTYNIISSDIKVLKDVKYLITLDEDTFIPRECASKLVGAMSHVLNAPYVKDNRVLRGYGVMQPKVSISLEAKNKTYFSRIFGGEGGVDGYSVAYSDTYQDLFGQGSFTGKGIIDIDEFYSILHTAIKDDRILSHDLLEGALTRCGLISQVELIDGYPAFYESSCRRLHRWVRGDWQLIGWLFSKQVSALNKWKILDNLRRSLLAPNILIALILSLTILNGRSQVALLCFLALMNSLVFTITDFVVTPKNKLMGTFKSFSQIILILTFLPYQAFLMMDAIIITLYRICISKKNLLEWESSDLVEKRYSNSFGSYLRRMWISPIMGLVILYLSIYNSIGVIIYSIVVAALWIVSPYVAYCISRKTDKDKFDLKNQEKSYLRQISRRIYAYYEDFVNEENNYLAPDNYQEKPFKGVAHRTSPTNIGMGLISNVVAYDLGYITMMDLIDKTELILNSMKGLQMVHGHYLNWYDTKTKAPLWPRYVSTVDSGNLLGDLWVLKQSMQELKSKEVIRINEVMSLKDIYKIIEEKDSSIKIRFASNINNGDYKDVLSEILMKVEGINKSEEDNIQITHKDYSDEKKNKEIEYWRQKLLEEANRKLTYYSYIFDGLEKLYGKEFLEGIPNIIELIDRCEDYISKFGDNFKHTIRERINNLKVYVSKIDNIIKEIDKISEEMDFRFLYDETRQLFSIGYNVEENSLGNSYYDLLASESRIASFIAVAKNDVHSSHWFKLSRAMTNAFHTHSLVSWSGTMFEYFMPSLIMRNYPKTLLSKTYKSVIKAQISFSKQKQTPWGISESAFYKFDVDDNYQYKAFGIPGLGLKRGLEDEVVISPYSTLMTLPFSRGEGIKNLRRLEEIGCLGRYGFIEAVDYTKARQDKYVVRIPKYSKSEEKLLNNSGILEETYTQNVDKYEKGVDNHVKRVDKLGSNIVDYDEVCNVNDVDNVDNCLDDCDTLDNIGNLENREELNNSQMINNVYNDGIKANKIMTYMVHHLGMSLMALDNVLLDNVLISRFHSLPEVKATELLLKEKIPNNITFERNEDFSAKNMYFEGESLIPRIFKGSNQNNPEVLLLSNGEYSSMITVTGSGYSKKNDMMLYRWKGNSTSDDSGMFFYVKNLNSNDYWSSTFEPCKNCGDKYIAEFNLDKAKFNRKDGNIETQMEIAVSPEENLEIRKITLNNLSDKGRSIEITSYMEITLATLSSDAVHPAFSNLFIQTEYDEKENILIGSRRGRVKGAKVPYIFHKVLANGDLEGSISYETSRINFIGRNRDLKSPLAMDNDKSLNNTVGTVLDPIMSIRCRIRLDGNSKKEIYYITGTTESKEEVIDICRKNKDAAQLEKVFENYSIETQLELKSLGIRSAQANIFQSLSSYIFFLHSGRKDREEYIKNISKHQKDLWSYGISGDLPIVFLTIENEDDISLVTNILRFHYYMKIKGVKLDLIVYNNEEISYDEPLQKSIIQAINTSNESSALNKEGGIFLHNKATMDEQVKNLLIGISRLYINSKKGSISQQIKNVEELGVNDDDEFSRYRKSVDEESYKSNFNTLLNNDEEEYVLQQDEELIEKKAKKLEINRLEKKSKPLNTTYKLEIADEVTPTLDDDKDSIKMTIANLNDGEIEYKEYDHDEDYIEKQDLIKGVATEAQESHKKIDLNKPNKEKVDEDFNMEDLDFFNGYGGFSKIDNSYLIKLSNFKNTPAPWINVISNDDFGFHISESGSSYTWCGNSRENKITPWSNDYIRDPLGEALYIRDDNTNDYFSITPKPVRDKGDYFIKHNFGYSEFKHTAYNIRGKLEVFAPKGEKVKIQKVTLENLSESDREISVFYYAKLVMGVYEYDSARYISTYIHGESKRNHEENILERGFIRACNPYSEYFGKFNSYLTILGGEKISFTGDNKEFIGANGEISSPKALSEDNLSNMCGAIYDPCLAATTKITIKKGEKVQLLILLGEEEKENIKEVINKYEIEGNADRELDKVKEYWRHFLGNIQVKTPDKSLDYLLNGWLLYQTLSCRYLSRSAFYQSGGAYGFRDQLQDSMALGVVNPEIPKAQILRSASRQYVEGDVQHWWHPVVNSGIRTRFSDDLLWLPYVTAEYINSTGDYGILEETAPYLEDEPLREGEDERYTIVNQSSKEGTIYEHCLKAIEKSLKFGEYNIPLMGSGDWNDGMSTVGNKGKGESVWLGWFLYSILESFIKIANIKNDQETKAHYEERKEFIRENLEKNAWDGGWYRRAYFDDGTPLGSRENPECQIDSLAQSWAIISEASKIRSGDELNENKFNSNPSLNNSNNKYEKECAEYSQRAFEAMEAVDKNLVKNEKGLILLLAPPFDNSYLEPGYIKGYVPGVRENGGQYTHAAVWVILALTKLGLGDKAVRYYNMINPINHTKTELECTTYKLEPYVMAADVYIKEPHGGRGGWSWYTGASGWMYRVGIEDILGLKRVENKGYMINPCIPKAWGEFEIRIKNDREDYNIKVIQNVDNNKYDNEKKVIEINGKRIEGMIIPRNLGEINVVVYV